MRIQEITLLSSHPMFLQLNRSLQLTPIITIVNPLNPAGRETGLAERLLRPERPLTG